jgi:hypothetical protein
MWIKVMPARCAQLQKIWRIFDSVDNPAGCQQSYRQPKAAAMRRFAALCTQLAALIAMTAKIIIYIAI